MDEITERLKTEFPVGAPTERMLRLLEELKKAEAEKAKRQGKA